jgi:hypothetical protein
VKAIETAGDHGILSVRRCRTARTSGDHLDRGERGAVIGLYQGRSEAPRSAA